MKLKLEDVLDCGWRDVQTLKEYLDKAEIFGITLQDIKLRMSEFGVEDYNVNSWIWCTIDLIFEHICYEIENNAPELEDEINRLRNNFCPYICYMDSHFNNEIDELSEWNSKEEVIKEIIKILKEGRNESKN